MKISTEIGAASEFVGEEKAIEYVAKAGFDAWDFSMFGMCRYDRKNDLVLENDHPLAGPRYLEFARKLKAVGLDNGIICNQAHAPYPSCTPKVRTYFRRAIECAAEAGAEILVIHPDDVSPEENREMYMEILPFAKECGVKIATENMWNWDNEKDIAFFAACATPESFNAHLDAVNDSFFTACLDIGHAEMMGDGVSAVDMIHKLGKRLTALHIHDNNKRYDCHQIPFSMDINFEEIVKALKEIDYRGYFTLEAGNYLKRFDADNVFQGIVDLKNSVRRLADMFEAM